MARIQRDQFSAELLEPVHQLHAQVRAAGELPERLRFELMHGTTIGAFLIEGGTKAIAFSDSKVSMGNKPISLSYRKMFKIDRHSRLLISGSPVLGKRYAKTLKVWVSYQQNTRRRPLMARAKTDFLERMVSGGIGLSGAGIVLAPIFVTFDIANKKRPRIFFIDTAGSNTEKFDFAMSGSGQNADIVLHETWDINWTEEQGIATVKHIIHDLIPRIDSFSGGPAHIDVISAEGVRTIKD